MAPAFVIFVLANCIILSLQQDQDREWQEFKQRYAEHFSSLSDEVKSYNNWRRCYTQINTFNRRQLFPSYTQSCYDFAIYSQSELAHLKKGLVVPESARIPPNVTRTSLPAGPLPQMIDLRQKGMVTDVKNQGYCGSCWAFSATGAIEAQLYKKIGSLVSLSEQQMIDCDGSNSACNGGWPQQAMVYVRNGLSTACSYPYSSFYNQRAGTCTYKTKNSIVKTQPTVSYQSVNEDDTSMMSALVNVGPLSIAVCANSNFQNYRTGVYTDSPCQFRDVDHAVLLVGYDTDPAYGPYWIVKNSWAASWGESGYIRMARGKGLIHYPVYPVIV